MPSAVVHLRVAYDLKERLGIRDTGRFYIGAVSPDAVNVDGFAPQSVRYPAHLRSTDYALWKQNVRDFYRDNTELFKKDADFHRGFLLHILTDIYWDELAQPQMLEGLKALGEDVDNIRDLKWKELYRFNAYLAGDWLYSEVFPEIAKVSDLPAVSTVEKEQLERYIASLTGSYMEERAINERPLVLDESYLAPVTEACFKALTELEG